ncbi:protein kinase domain-containing protein [Sedimenticola sp.]|uniref:protein kinase domain-containing protein n=1 Tax=Sedimenticola sp. TaxID=1940285 RepID=UPI003D0C85A5
MKVSVGQFSDKGRKAINQDFHGVLIPKEPLLTSKGVAIALADGISSSDVSQVASEASVRGFLDDYYCTSEAWSVKKSAHQVLYATNSWLYSQTQKSQHRYNKDKGYVCTLSALIFKSTTAHIFHIGDSRIYRLRNHTLEPLTIDHRLWLSDDKSYLSRGLGIDAELEIDYRSLHLEIGDIFLLMTDGVYEYASTDFILDAIHNHDLDDAAKAIADEAYKQGSDDNLTIQIIRIEELPSHCAGEIFHKMAELPLPPILEPRTLFDGYTIMRTLHDSSRSHVYLAKDNETDTLVVIKTPSIDLQTDEAYLERFLMEEWIARRINNAHVLKPCLLTRQRNYIYLATEFIEGQTLTQWMIDNPRPELEKVRDIVEQIARGLNAFHRQEMLHQDLRPENIMIDSNGMVKIIDFGATKVAGIVEISSPLERQNILGTAQYTAPEYFLGEPGSFRSDIFSLGVIAYQLLSGRLPYGAQIAKSRTKSAQNRLRYHSVLDDEREIPAWIDETLRKCVHINPYKRYEVLSEFVYDLRHPTQAFLNRTRPPLIERNPLLFWKGLSLILTVIVVILLSGYLPPR